MAEEYESVDLVADDTVRQFALAVLVAAATGALAQLSIPIPGTGVPFSLQPFGMFFAGLLLGPLWGGLAMGLYLLAGAAGAPIFSNGTAGLGVLFGNTGGFLLGYLFGAVVVGGIVHRRAEPRSLDAVPVPLQVGGLLVGLAVLYLVGVPWMASVLGIALVKSASIMVPYAVVDVAKVGVAVGIVERGDLLRR
jgi:biotin transport system substrate-specific component